MEQEEMRGEAVVEETAGEQEAEVRTSLPDADWGNSDEPKERIPPMPEEDFTFTAESGRVYRLVDFKNDFTLRQDVYLFKRCKGVLGPLFDAKGIDGAQVAGTIADILEGDELTRFLACLFLRPDESRFSSDRVDDAQRPDVKARLDDMLDLSHAQMGEVVERFFSSAATSSVGGFLTSFLRKKMAVVAG